MLGNQETHQLPGQLFFFPIRGGKSVRKCARWEVCSQVCQPLMSVWVLPLIVVRMSHLPASAAYKRHQLDSSSSNCQLHCPKYFPTRQQLSSVTKWTPHRRLAGRSEPYFLGWYLEFLLFPIQDFRMVSLISFICFFFFFSRDNLFSTSTLFLS